jgi:hypothetical protein
VLPVRFDWPLFVAGLALMAAPVAALTLTALRTGLSAAPRRGAIDAAGSEVA